MTPKTVYINDSVRPMSVPANVSMRAERDAQRITAPASTSWITPVTMIHTG